MPPKWIAEVLFSMACLPSGTAWPDWNAAFNSIQSAATISVSTGIDSFKASAQATFPKSLGSSYR